MSSHESDSEPTRLFSRLPRDMRAGEVIELAGTPGWWRVETAKLADDGKDTKCVLVRAEAPR
jgi:hypothetical protein